MKCPYCNKVVKDIPNHLMSSSKCKTKHVEKINLQFKVGVKKNEENQYS